jgi:hypothetical protein
MSDWKRHLQDTIVLIVGAVVFLVLFVVGIYLLSYVIIGVAIMGIIAFIVAQVSGFFRTQKNGTKGHSGQRIIDHDEHEKR